MNSIHILTLTLAVTLLFLNSSASSAATCNKYDKKALMTFKKHFPRNTFTRSWETYSDCCFWSGVGCDKKTGRVTSLFFTAESDDSDHIPVDLKGTIPPSIGDLTALDTVSLHSLSNLVGPLPPTMANLKKLQYFTIYNCSISGPLPNFFDKWTSLVELEINRCPKLTGPIPSSLGSLTKLATVIFDSNKLTGTIPASLFSKLDKGLEAELVLSGNMLTGPVPQSFSGVKWRNLDVSDNQLCGKIPTGGNYSSFNGAPFDHNKCLCGKPLPACK